MKQLYLSVGWLMAFVLWTVAVCFVDVKPIGPMGSSVGFATVNGYFHNLTGAHLSLYVITDWLGLIPVFFGFGFTLLGLIQWVKRRSILKVDFSILALGGFYLVTLAVYLFFEEFVVNYRPVLLNGVLEASYPSSTTMLVMCMMPTAMMQLNHRIKNHLLGQSIACALIVFIVFMVICRLVSGVHWLTDIIGGGLFSVGLVTLYDVVCKSK
jgi:undecaprenyl-diphosphatase